MRATVMYGAGDVRVEQVPDPVLIEPTDAIVRITRSCICGSDLWPYKHMKPDPHGRRMGHEFIGVVEETGSDVHRVSRGDVVVAPFMYCDNTCDFCKEGLHTSCRRGGAWGMDGVDGGQGEAVRSPLADGTLVTLPVAADDPLMPSLLTLSDVLCTGHHAVVTSRVEKGSTVAVIGDGAVGLCGVLAARRAGAERILLLGHHRERTDLGRAFGATDVVVERGDEAVAHVRELTGGDGAHSVLECVGLVEAYRTALGITRPGGAVGRVGVPQYETAPLGRDVFRNNITVSGGVAPARAYIEELMPDILEGRIEPGRVFDMTVDLDGVPQGYRAMNERRALKVLITP
ncbi:zinc-dependent alcohol dehydrogenase family protein [Pseudonocardia acidicola]|uniref:Zinc-dependent alcohol dehydrogenase family protein n=1 Tax=Pseudonocardia acidicola TaxID=2724939 RepID=A0ABX1SEI4_9PSEU|nr:zinc-dependent alcohol dehydrogenase family protein [Pseudonocardia acidicola]NMH98608.1 zinc-dependent alcohol dehydrogenase family protein [Pseudonocardia acidicola]